MHGVNPSISVDDFKAKWASFKKVDVDSALISLKLVKCGKGKPSAAEEAVATKLDDPSATLLEAGLAPLSWLLADFDLAPGARHAAAPVVRRALRRLNASARNARSARYRCAACPGQAGHLFVAPLSSAIVLFLRCIGVEEQEEARAEQAAYSRSRGVRPCRDSK